MAGRDESSSGRARSLQRSGTLVTGDHAWLDRLPVTRAIAWLRPEGDWLPTPEPAVTLRGALGAALFELACVRADRDCGACVHQRECVIPGWYDPNRVAGNRPRPFVLRVVADPGGLVADLTFLGPVPSDVIVATLRAAARGGLGPERTPFRVVRLDVEGAERATVLFDDAAPQPWPHPAPLASFVRLPPRPRGARILIDRVTLPSRWAEPSLGAIVHAATLRVRAIGVPPGDRWWPDVDVPSRWEGAFVHGHRWSMRQEEDVDLSGWTGEIEADDVAPWADVLAAAEVLGVGKNTTCGAGRVSVEWIL